LTNCPELKALKYLFQGPEINCRLFFPFLGTMVICLISSTSLSIKEDVFAAKEAQERQEIKELQLQIKRRNYKRV